MGHYHPGRRFSLAELEELLAGELPDDDDPDRPTRTRLERRRDELKERDAAVAQRAQETDDLGPRELAALISPGRSGQQTKGDDDPRQLADRVPRR
jgi:hypothetical protein